MVGDVSSLPCVSGLLRVPERTPARVYRVHRAVLWRPRLAISEGRSLGMADGERLVAGEALGAVLVEGPLRKSTAKGHTFQKRWVWLLENGVLQYTKGVRRHDSPTAKRTTINLTDAQLVIVSDSGGKFVFRLRWEHATREYSFAADDAEDLRRWHTAVVAAIPTTVTLSFVQNERFNEATGRWGADALLPSDPPACCDNHGTAKSLQTEPCPDEHWQWTGQWEIDTVEWRWP